MSYNDLPAYLQVVYDEIVQIKNYTEDEAAAFKELLIKFNNSHGSDDSIYTNVLTNANNPELGNFPSSDLTPVDTEDTVDVDLFLGNLFARVLRENPSLISMPSPSASEVIMHVPCIYSTYVSSAATIDLRSPHYQFANFVDSLPLCSSKKHNAERSSSELPYCTFIHNHMECPDYAPLSTVLSTATISVTNTPHAIEFDLVYSPMINLIESRYAHCFSIRNVTDDTLVSKLAFPDSEVTYEDAVVEAKRAFDDYLTAFEQESVTLADSATDVSASSNSSTGPSYFEHLLSTR